MIFLFSVYISIVRVSYPAISLELSLNEPVKIHINDSNLFETEAYLLLKFYYGSDRYAKFWFFWFHCSRYNNLSLDSFRLIAMIQMQRVLWRGLKQSRKLAETLEPWSIKGLLCFLVILLCKIFDSISWWLYLTPGNPTHSTISLTIIFQFWWVFRSYLVHVLHVLYMNRGSIGNSLSVFTE